MRREIKLREVQLLEFETLCQFDAFCKKYNIPYSLAYGTLLGAARHQGFIPWDDDVDVMLLRPDFERLAQLLRDTNELPYAYGAHGNGFYPFIKIHSTRGYTDVRNLKENGVPLWIDVFPLDGLPEDPEQTKKAFKKIQFLRKILLVRNTRLGEGGTKKRAAIKIVLYPLAKLIPNKWLIRTMEQTAKQVPYEEAKYIGDILWGNPYKSTLPMESGSELTELPFEKCPFPVIENWDALLKQLYGDYMTPRHKSTVDHPRHLASAWTEE